MSNHEASETSPQAVFKDFLFEGKRKERKAFDRYGYAELQDILQPGAETDLEDFADFRKVGSIQIFTTRELVGSADALGVLETRYVIDTDKREVVRMKVDEESIRDHLPEILEHDSKRYAMIRTKDGLVFHKKKKLPLLATPIPQCA